MAEPCWVKNLITALFWIFSCWIDKNEYCKYCTGTVVTSVAEPCWVEKEKFKYRTVLFLSNKNENWYSGSMWKFGSESNENGDPDPNQNEYWDPDLIKNKNWDPDPNHARFGSAAWYKVKKFIKKKITEVWPIPTVSYSDTDTLLKKKKILNRLTLMSLRKVK